MLILLPVLLTALTSLTLLFLRWFRPKFQFPWIIAAGGALLALASVFLWKIHFPGSVSLPSWNLASAISYVPSWLADDISFPYTLAIASLTTAIIWTSVVREESSPIPWAGTLILSALGILAVTAGNPITLILTWTAIDLYELVTMQRSVGSNDQNESVIIAFIGRVAGTGLVVWADLISVAGGSSLDFRSISENAGMYLLMAACLRLGVWPLNLFYSKDIVIRRGFGTALNLISAAASLSLLPRIPASVIGLSLTPYLLFLTAISALYAGWMWLRTSDEILGRPYWIMGLASFAVAETLHGNPTGSIGWGVALVLCGGALFLFSARQGNILWLPLLSLWVFSTLPFSLTASSWHTSNNFSILYLIPFIPALSLFLAGFFRHASHQGEKSLVHLEKWQKAIYPVGLLFMWVIALLLGFWGWTGALNMGVWWLATLASGLATGFAWFAPRALVRLPVARFSSPRNGIIRLDWFYHFLTMIYNFIRRIADLVTSAFEGEGGLLWTLLLLVLIYSIFSVYGR